MIRKILLLSVLLLSGCGVQVVRMDSEKPDTVTEYEIIHTDENEEVTLNIVDWSDSTKKSREELNAKFMADYPNVTINYTTLTQAQFNETMLSGIRSGNAPDLFPLPSTINFSTAIDEGWFIPLNNYLDNPFFDKIKSGLLQNNVTNVGEDVYLLPEAEEISSTLLFYNKSLLKEAGISLEEYELPLTWEEFASISKAVTEQGQGNYYGNITSGAQKNRLDLELRSFSEVAGSNIGPAEQLFLDDSRVVFDSQEVLDAFDLYSELYQAGTFHPDTASLSAPEARQLFAENKAAFIAQGAWCIPIWDANNPELEYGVMKVPVPSRETNGKMIQPFTKGWMGISSSSEHPDIAAKYLEYLYSYEYQHKLVELGGFVSILKSISSEDISNQNMRDYYRFALEQSSAIDNPVVQNPDLELVYQIIQPVVPDFGDIASSIFTGNSNYHEKLNQLSIQTQKNLVLSVESIARKIDIEIADFNNKQAPSQ